MIKGTASLILSHPPCKDLQRYPGNLNCIKNVEDVVIFMTRKVFFFLLVSPHLHRETGNENIHFKQTVSVKINMSPCAPCTL